MITVKARLSDATDDPGGPRTGFRVLELTTTEGEDLTDLVSQQDVFVTLEQLNAFLTLRLARETQAELAEDHSQS